MAKRIFDLCTAALALLLLWPLLLLLALWIKLDSPGPVLFRQERVGRHGVLFRIHKFRTMAVDAPTRGPQITLNADARLTGVGRRLRQYRLDELPRLIDVLRGRMSLVGPRPEVPHFVAHYPEVPHFVAHYPEALRVAVLAVRPGLTDPAAIAHLDEAALLAGAQDPERAYIENILPTKLRLQAEYAGRATLRSDLAVLLQTVSALLGRRRSGAAPS